MCMFCINVTSLAWRFGVFIPCCVCVAVGGEAGWRTEAGILACADLVSCSEGLMVFFCLRTHPWTTELDKPRHFRVTSLGLMSGLGCLVRSGYSCFPPFSPLPSFLPPTSSSQSQSQAYVRFLQPYNNNMAELVIILSVGLCGNRVLSWVLSVVRLCFPLKSLRVVLCYACLHNI